MWLTFPPSRPWGIWWRRGVAGCSRWGGLGVPVGAVVIFDPDEDLAVEPGDVVLAVGVDARRPEARDLIRRAGAAGAAAVVVKVRDDASNQPLVDVAGEAAVAVLAATPDVAWGQLH